MVNGFHLYFYIRSLSMFDIYYIHIYLKVYKILGNCELQNIPKKMYAKSVKNALKQVPHIFGHKLNFSPGYFHKDPLKKGTHEL